MSVWARMWNVFRGDAVNEEIAEELEVHVSEAVAAGRDEREARRAMGCVMRQREDSHQVRVIGWMDSLRMDVVFGWRQLWKRKVTTVAAVLSLGLAIGACTAAFRLVDALFLRPMPVSDPASLYSVQYNGFNNKTGEPTQWWSNSYPQFRMMREALRGQADVVAVDSQVGQTDLTYGSVQETEKAYRQRVSGEMFSNFGLRPTLGRVLNASDDAEPGKSPYAVLSYDYWKRRFGGDPEVVGRTFHQGDTVWEIVGVAPKGFVGTEPGTMVDIFTPVMMEAGEINRDSDFWLRIFVRVKPGVNVAALQSKMDSLYEASEKERAKGFKNVPKGMDKYPTARLTLISSGGGVSVLQADYRAALTALSVLVVLVLLIACANVANLMSAQAAARGREMALRVSLGSGRWRLVRLMLIESGMLGLMAAGVGLGFAWRAAPLVVGRINPADNPAQLMLPLDWPVLVFGSVLAMGVTLLFGLLPALRASDVKPVSALKGGEEPHGKRRMMYGLIAAQVAFCFVVLFVAGLFAQTFIKLTRQPLGFSAERVVLLDTVAEHTQAAVRWDQLAAALHSVPGVEATALENRELGSSNMNNNRISVYGSTPSETLTFFMRVSPGWLDTMRIALLSGRDFRDNDMTPNVAIVNETFAKTYFHGANPVGSFFVTKGPDGTETHYEIVGMTQDAIYRDNLREVMLPQAYTPIHRVPDAAAGLAPVAGALRTMGGAVIVARTSASDPTAVVESLRRAVTQFDPEFRVSHVVTQQGLVEALTIRERLLAALAGFFAGVALLLAAIGLYGVLHYSVLQREREIGVRIALGAGVGNIARIVGIRVFAMVLVGGAVGLMLGMVSVRYVQTLLYGVKGDEMSTMGLPFAVLLGAAALAALPAVLRAVRIDPVVMLRSE